jgi:signal transduction histidine kinase
VLFLHTTMQRRTIIIGCSLLLVPALLIAGAAFQLLRHEQDRLNQLARSSAVDRARGMADRLRASVQAVEDQLSADLRAMPQTDLVRALIRWQGVNPFVRNVFVWREQGGLVVPAADLSFTAEERRFVGRYEALFTGRIPWRRVPDEARHVTSAVQRQGEAGRSLQTQEAGQTVPRAGRHTIIHHRGQFTEQPAVTWIPWFAENRLFKLGWTCHKASGTVYGVELELMAVLARLVALFPREAPHGVTYVLLNGEGHFFHQIGNGSPGPDQAPDFSVSLQPQLPHWRMGGYLDPGSVASTGSAFLILSSLLLATFVAAIVLGGSLLLWQAHRNMRDAMRKTTFVSNVSHELKTPLTSIRMYAELLREGRVRDPDRQSRYLDIIVDESRRLTRLVNNVLDFGRLEQGRKHYQYESVELSGLLRQVLDAHRVRIQSAGLAVQEEIPDRLFPVRIDRDAMEQVLLNLIDNGIKYASEGGELTIRLSADDAGCRIEVMDRGPGVPEAHRRRIFEVFHRVDDSLITAKPGAGLGLSIARRLMQDMGGALTFDPRTPTGSLFTAWLPLERDDPDA